MKTVIWLNPTGRDKREIARLRVGNDVQFMYHTYAQESLKNACVEQRNYDNFLTERTPSDEIERLTMAGHHIPIHGIMTSRDYPSNTIVTCVSQNLGFPTSSVASNLVAQHKYYAREAIRPYIPEIMPSYEMLSYDEIPQCSLQPPYIIKPVKAAGSLGTYYIRTYDDLHTVHNLPSYTYYKPFARLLEQYTQYRIDAPYVIAEQCATGTQVTADGFVWNETVYMIGIVDSHFFPDTLSFSKFTYPSQLAHTIQQRIYEASRRCITTLGLNNTLFNIEFVYNAEHDTITMIEINPRMSSQFNLFYEYVDNISLYQIGLDITLGNTPHMPSHPGHYTFAGSFVMRTYHDYFVQQVPKSHELYTIQQQYPHTSIEITCTPGKYLSEIEQDTFTYRYAIINIVALCEQQAHEIYNDIQNMLSFSFV